MAKKPARKADAAKSPKLPSDLVGADIRGETPAKASPVPADAEVAFNFGQELADGGELHRRPEFHAHSDQCS